MVLTYYGIGASAPSRAVTICLRLLGCKYENHTVDVFNREHFSPQYLKMNPQHTFPVIVDDDFVIIDSHAIMAYLVSSYGKNDDLYPSDLKKRSMIDHRMYFECGVVFPHLRRLVFLLRYGSNGFTENDIQPIRDTYSMVEAYLGKYSYIAGNDITIADISFNTTIPQINLLVPELMKTGQYPLLADYLSRCSKDIKHLEEVNQDGFKVFVDYVRDVYKYNIVNI